MKTKELTECQKFRANVRKVQWQGQLSKVAIIEMMMQLLEDIKEWELKVDDIVDKINSGMPQAELVWELEALSHEMMTVNL